MSITYKVERITPVRRGGKLQFIPASRYTYPVIRSWQLEVT